MLKRLPSYLFIVFCIIILALSVRGISGNPTDNVINNTEWKDEGPFELSPERGRFALTFSLVENKSVWFPVPVARFAMPDLGYKDGRYVSLFAPGVSFVTAPGYIFGKLAGSGQVGSFAVISLFALGNALLIRAIALKLNVHPLAATSGALIFLFATPAFAYAVSLYQHHISTFLILLSIYLLLRWNNWWSLALIWFLTAAGIPIDYPNLFLMLPIAVFAMGRIFYTSHLTRTLVINIKPFRLLTLLVAIIPLAFFLWFNQASYGNPFQLSGTIKSIKGIDADGNPLSPEKLAQQKRAGFQLEDLTRKKTATGFFKTRNLLNGFYIHFISPDRGVFWFTPVILLSFFGMVHLYRKNQKTLTLLLGVIGADIVLYSMWGDPWGGWAFGSRYFIPAYAVSAILLAVTLSSLRKNLFFLLFFLILASYSIAVNTLGALTTNRNPPQVEVLQLEQLSGREEKYTYERNLDYLLSNHSKSFLWQTWARNFVSARDYFLILSGLIILANLIVVVFLRLRKDGTKNLYV